VKLSNGSSIKKNKEPSTTRLTALLLFTGTNRRMITR